MRMQLQFTTDLVCSVSISCSAPVGTNVADHSGLLLVNSAASACLILPTTSAANGFAAVMLRVTQCSHSNMW
jgi:hypothetical protein